MDDAHIFCTPEQIEDEIYDLLDLVDYVYGTFGLEYRVHFATRPQKRIGSEENWDMAEEALRKALERRDLTYTVDEGGGAFYGPKIDAMFVDAIGRQWQGSTIQLDFVLPERFDLAYIGPSSPGRARSGWRRCRSGPFRWRTSSPTRRGRFRKRCGARGCGRSWTTEARRCRTASVTASYRRSRIWRS